jgi:hypothetical protein
MGFLTHLKKTEHDEETRWIVKYDKKNLVREVKQIYKPSEYYASNLHRGKNARPLHNKNVLIKILEDDKEARH